MKKHILIRITLLFISFFVFGCASRAIPAYTPNIPCSVNGQTTISKEEKTILVPVANLYPSNVYFRYCEFQNKVMEELIKDGWTVIVDEARMEEVAPKPKFYLTLKNGNSGSIFITEFKTGKLVAGVIFDYTTWEILKDDFMAEVKKNIIVK